ncbi:MAG: hypothetical protein WCS37_08930 [Chloroflexota bacterium]|nr:PD40 domain-containing protein [Chloroflexota bacterium]
MSQPQMRVKAYKVDDNRTVACLNWSPNGQTLAIGYRYDTVSFWHIEQGVTLKETLKISTGDVTRCMAFSPNGKILARGGTDKTVQLWDVALSKKLAELDKPIGVKAKNFGPYTPLGFIRAFAFSPDGQTLAFNVVSGLYLWSLGDGKLVRLGDDIAKFNNLTYHPNGELLTRFGNSEAEFWDVNSQSLRGTVATGADRGAWSPDGQLLATTEGKLLKIAVEKGGWFKGQKLTGSVVRAIENQSCDSILWNPKRELLATAGDEVKLWNATDGRLLTTLQDYERPSLQEGDALSWSPDGKKLVGGSQGCLMVWSID